MWTLYCANRAGHVIIDGVLYPTRDAAINWLIQTALAVQVWELLGPHGEYERHTGKPKRGE